VNMALAVSNILLMSISHQPRWQSVLGGGGGSGQARSANGANPEAYNGWIGSRATTITIPVKAIPISTSIGKSGACVILFTIVLLIASRPGASDPCGGVCASQPE